MTKFSTFNFGPFVVYSTIQLMLPPTLKAMPKCELVARMIEAGMIFDPPDLDNWRSLGTLSLAVKYASERQGRGRGRDLATNELFDILMSYESTPLKIALDAWRIRHGVGVKFVWSDEIRGLAQQFANEGLLTDTGFRRSFGRIKKSKFESLETLTHYIDAQVWTLLVGRGNLPLADPHDVISHLPSLLDDRFTDLLKQNAKLRYLVISYARSQTRETKWAHVEPLENELAQLRNHTYENLSFFAEGTTDLILQGNGGFNFIHDLRMILKGRRSSRDAVETLMSEKAFNPNSLFRYEKFASSHSSVVDRFMSVLRQMGLDSQDALDQRTLLVDKLLTESIEESSSDDSEEGIADQAMQIFGVKMHGHPELVEVFSRENRLALLEAGNKFFEAYYRWLLKVSWDENNMFVREAKAFR